MPAHPRPKNSAIIPLMAKPKGHSDWAIVLVIALLLVASNAYWLLVTNEMNDRLDRHAEAILQLDASHQ